MRTRMFSLLSSKYPQFHQHKQQSCWGSLKNGEIGETLQFNVNLDPTGLEFFAVFFERLESMEIFLWNIAPIHNFRVNFLRNCVPIAVVKNPPKQMRPTPLALLQRLFSWEHFCISSSVFSWDQNWFCQKRCGSTWSVEKRWRNNKSPIGIGSFKKMWIDLICTKHFFISLFLQVRGREMLHKKNLIRRCDRPHSRVRETWCNVKWD